MKTNQRGFSHIVILLLFVFIAVIGAVAYRIQTMSNDQQPTAVTTTKAPTTSAQPTIADADGSDAGLTRYVDKDYKFSFEYPKGWIISKEAPSPGVTDIGFKITKTTKYTRDAPVTPANPDELILSLSFNTSPSVVNSEALSDDEDIIGAVVVNETDVKLVSATDAGSIVSISTQRCIDMFCAHYSSLSDNLYMAATIGVLGNIRTSPRSVNTESQEYKDMVAIIASVRQEK